MSLRRSLDSEYPPEFAEAGVALLLSTVKDWSIAHGLAIRPSSNFVAAEVDPVGVLATSAPVTLFPSPFSDACFTRARKIQRVYNQLYAAIAQDEEFLQSSVEDILAVDDFTASLWKVHLKVKREGYTQPFSLGLFRSDYMVHQTSAETFPELKQVEFNTIASSFGGLASKCSEMHKHMAIHTYPVLDPRLILGAHNLPENRSIESLSSGLAHAFDTYSASGPKCILFLVSDVENNVFDQRFLELALQERTPSIPVYRLPFSAVLRLTSLADGPKRELYYHLPSNPTMKLEVAVVYFRAAYAPSHYEFAQGWEARFQIERSHAIKCPSVLTQLAGIKKVQQILARPYSPDLPSPVARFLPQSLSDIDKLSATFTNIYPLDDTPLGLEAQRLALDPQACQNYVLKPQREGGGNNIYRQAIPGFLTSIPKGQWKSYILMEMIIPPPLRNTILRNGTVEEGDVICELGIFGTCLWDSSSGQILRNEEAGYLLRTKSVKSEEGGVASGFGSLDSCLLV